MTHAAALAAKARDRSAVFGIVGLGYVGLPLAIEIARAGYRVVGFDVNSNVVGGVNRGKSHVLDVPAKVLEEFVEAGRIEATSDMTRLAEVDVVSICVPHRCPKPRTRTCPMS